MIDPALTTALQWSSVFQDCKSQAAGNAMCGHPVPVPSPGGGLMQNACRVQFLPAVDDPSLGSRITGASNAKFALQLLDEIDVGAPTISRHGMKKSLTAAARNSRALEPSGAIANAASLSSCKAAICG